jgi:hypothetical protein
MERKLAVMALLAATLLCGCEDAARSRSLDDDIERARAQIAARVDEKQRIDGELQKLDRLVPENQRLQARVRALETERGKLLAQLAKGRRKTK